MSLVKRIEEHIRVIEDFPQKGVSFKDFSEVFQNPQLSKDVIEAFASKAKGKVDCVCGIESRGFIFGFPIALALNVPFVLVRKKGKLPPTVVSTTYKLEYGEATLEMVEGHILKGARVMIHDDVLATGGTASACADLVRKVGAIPSYYSFLIELDFLNGRNKIGEDVEIHSILRYD